MNFSFWKRAFVSPVGLCACLSLGLASSSFAQEEEHHWAINVGGGFTTITGCDSITGNFMFNHLGITGSELAARNEPDGNARVYTFTADPTLRLRLGSRANIYVLAGGGYLRRTVQFTQPTVAQTVVFNPWWGYLGPELIPVNQVLGTFTSKSGGALYAWFHQQQRYVNSSNCVRRSVVGEG